MSLGSSKGLLIAKAFGMRAVGVVDGAYSAVLESSDNIDAILKACRDAAPAVAKVVETVLGNCQKVAPEGASFAVGTEKAVAWNDTPLTVQNEQEDPEEVTRMASELPDVSHVFIFKAPCALFDSLKSRLTKESKAGESVVFSGELFGKNIAVAIATRKLARAFASKKVNVIALGIAFATTSAVTEKHVQVVDHFNLSGLYALVGHNKGGVRFPDMSHMYADVAGLPKVISFHAADMRVATPAFTSGMSSVLNCQVVSDFGAEYATIVRHQDGSYKQIYALVANTNDEWTIEDSLLTACLS